MKRRIPALGVCAALTLAVSLIVVAFWHSDAVSTESQSAIARQNTPTVVSALSALETSPEVVVRVEAARTVADSNKTLTADDIQRLGNRLTADSTSLVRSEIATSFQRVATEQNKGDIWIGPHEDQMIKALSAAYHKETDIVVKVSIIRSASAFNHPDASALIDEAAASKDPALVEAAGQAKQAIVNRRILKTASQPRTNTWK